MCKYGDLCSFRSILSIYYNYFVGTFVFYVSGLAWKFLFIYIVKCIRKLIIIHCNQVQVRREIWLLHWLFLVSAHHIFTLFIRLQVTICKCTSHLMKPKPQEGDLEISEAKHIRQ